MRNDYYYLTGVNDYAGRYCTIDIAREAGSYYVDEHDSLVKIWHYLDGVDTLVDVMAAYSEIID